MIGQVRFAWISFKRSFLASFFSFISQIVTYTAITISIAIFSITKPFLYRAISQIYYKSYISMGILFIVVGIIIGGVVTHFHARLCIHNTRTPKNSAGLPSP